jgi:hypothetical protein
MSEQLIIDVRDKVDAINSFFSYVLQSDKARARFFRNPIKILSDFGVIPQEHLSDIPQQTGSYMLH